MTIYVIFPPCISQAVNFTHCMELQSSEDCLQLFRITRGSVSEQAQIAASLLDQHEPSSYCVPSILMMMNYIKPTDLKYHPSWMHQSSRWATGCVHQPANRICALLQCCLCLSCILIPMNSQWNVRSWRSAHPLKTYKVYKVNNLSRCCHISPLAIPIQSVEQPI